MYHKVEPVRDALGIKPGQSVRINYGKNHPANKLLHIRAIVDDYQIVHREWSRRKQRWVYGVDGIGYFEAANKLGLLELARLKAGLV